MKVLESPSAQGTLGGDIPSVEYSLMGGQEEGIAGKVRRKSERTDLQPARARGVPKTLLTALHVGGAAHSLTLLIVSRRRRPFSPLPLPSPLPSLPSLAIT